MRLANPFDISGQLDNPAVRLRIVHWLADYAADTGLGPVTSIAVDSVLIQIGIDPQPRPLLTWLADAETTTQKGTHR